MKRITIILSLITECLMIWSCVSIDEIQNLQNQIDQITDTQIKSIEQQLNSIKTSITDWRLQTNLCSDDLTAISVRGNCIYHLMQLKNCLYFE